MRREELENLSLGELRRLVLERWFPNRRFLLAFSKRYHRKAGKVEGLSREDMHRLVRGEYTPEFLKRVDRFLAAQRRLLIAFLEYCEREGTNRPPTRKGQGGA